MKDISKIKKGNTVQIPDKAMEELGLQEGDYLYIRKHKHMDTMLCTPHVPHKKEDGCKRCRAELGEDYVYYDRHYRCIDCFEHLRAPDIRL